MRNLSRFTVQQILAPEAGFEPATGRLTIACSTAELLWNKRYLVRPEGFEPPTLSLEETRSVL